MAERCLTVANLLSILVILFGPQAAVRAQADRRHQQNVLLIVSDDQQHNAMSCAGHPMLQTPAIDRLARSGVRFTHAFVSVPICTPSRAALLTGRFETSNGVSFFGQRLNSGIEAWPKTMSRAGYQTAFTGKWHNVRDCDEYGFEWTANMFMRGMGYHIDPPMMQKPRGEEKIVQGEMNALISDAGIRFLAERDTQRPFFLYVAYTAPHDPRDPLLEYAEQFDANRVALPENFLPAPRFDPGTLNIRDETLLPVPRPELDLKREIAHYYGLIKQMDDQIGRLLKALEDEQLSRHTIVIFASDNGLALGAHGFLGKQTLYDEGVRVPLIIAHPEYPRRAGQTTDALVYLLDLMPTVCDWTNVSVPPGVEGKSLVRVLSGELPAVRDSVIGRYDEKQNPRFRMIRTNRYKLIHYFKAHREELFDLQSDPYEMNDLSSDPKMQTVCSTLRESLHRALAEQKDEIGLSAWRE